MKITLNLADCMWLACGGTLELEDGTHLEVESDLGGIRQVWNNVAAFVDNDGGSRHGDVKPLGESLERLVYGPEEVECVGGCGATGPINHDAWVWADARGDTWAPEDQKAPWCEECLPPQPPRREHA